jgi:hypothetical protein
VNPLTAIFLVAAALLTLITAFTHSYFGEQRLIGPLVASSDGVMFDAVLTRGKHIGWPMLTAIGLFSLLALT